MKRDCEDLTLRQKLNYQLATKDQCGKCKDNRECTFKILEI